MRHLYQLLFTSRQKWIMFNRKQELKNPHMWHREGETPQMVNPQPHGVTHPGATFELPTQLVLNLPNRPDVNAHSLHGWDPKRNRDLAFSLFSRYHMGVGCNMDEWNCV